MADWLNPVYVYRKQLTIQNNETGSSLAAGYTIAVTVNTNQLITDSKMRSDGNDLRVAYWNGASNVELDRHILYINTTSTQLIFKTQAAIPASDTDPDYYMYYGHPSALAGPSDKDAIYTSGSFDDFDEISSNWTLFGGVAATAASSIATLTGNNSWGSYCNLTKNTGISCEARMVQMWCFANFAHGGWTDRGVEVGFQINPTAGNPCSNYCCKEDVYANQKHYAVIGSDAGSGYVRTAFNAGTGAATMGTEYTPTNAFKLYRIKIGNAKDVITEDTTEKGTSTLVIGGTSSQWYIHQCLLAFVGTLKVDWTAISPYTNVEPTVTFGDESGAGAGETLSGSAISLPSSSEELTTKLSMSRLIADNPASTDTAEWAVVQKFASVESTAARSEVLTAFLQQRVPSVESTTSREEEITIRTSALKPDVLISLPLSSETISASVSGQRVPPATDVTDDNWTPSEGADLYSCIDEQPALDADYITSAEAPTDDECEVQLMSAEDPVSSTNHVVQFRYRKFDESGDMDLTVSLVEGTTVRATRTYENISQTWTSNEFTLTQEEADSIVNYGDLRLRFKANQVA